MTPISYFLYVDLPCGLLMTLHNISKMADEFRYDFEELNMVQVVLKCLETIKEEKPENINIYVMLSYLTLANVMNDKEIETLPDSENVVETLVQLLRVIANRDS